MGTLSARSAAFGGAHGTGGSGGGGPNKNLFPKPEPQAVLGVNSAVVYGSNVQMAFPTNFQLALGTNLQVCINPNAWQTLCMDGGVRAVPMVRTLCWAAAWVETCSSPWARVRIS